MKKLFLLIWSAASLISCNQQKKSETTEAFIEFSLKNDDSITHTDEQIVIRRSQLAKLEEQWEKGLLPIISFEKDTIPSQVDDLDGDGTWDELAFLYDIPAESEKKLLLTAVTEATFPEFPDRANAFLGKSGKRDGKFVPVEEEILPEDHLPQSKPPLYQMEGPVWENDLGAFRLYFDTRSGKDIFGKSTSEIMMDSVGLPGGDYHTQANWGMDVLKVGNSLGAGAVAFLLEDAEGNESLYRLGPEVREMKYSLVTDGPVRSILRIEYNGASIGGEIFDVEDEITIWGGSPGYKSKITVTGNDTPVKLVTGIVNLFHTKSPVKKETTNFVMLATHDQQSENKDILGMAIVSTSNNFIKFDEEPEGVPNISDTYTVVFNIQPNQPVSYEFLSVWEGRNKEYADLSNFLSLIDTYAQEISSPVAINIL